MQLRNPALRFLISTNTPTGLAILNNRLSDYATPTYLPIDFPGATKRYFAKKNISCLWVVETEIWPWLFSHAKNKGIPITLVNARLSHKSRGKLANFFKHTYARALSDVVVLARSNEDAKRYEQQGAEANNISVIGNLKYASLDNTQAPRAPINHDYVLAASTHDDEELQLARAWLNGSTEQLLVIVPRHPERGTRLKKSLDALQQTMQPDLPAIAMRSMNEHPTEHCKLYLADTLGEMHDWYSHAKAAFIGGSLIQRGGHNVLEAGRVATPVIVGPHTFNFCEEVELLNSVQAIALADNAEEVVRFLTLANTNSKWAQDMGEHAKAVINKQSDVVDCYIASLSKTVDKPIQSSHL